MRVGRVAKEGMNERGAGPGRAGRAGVGPLGRRRALG